jgi:hypothetical protein
VAGVKSKAKSNSEQGWLTEEEEDTIVDYAIRLAEIGWPPSLQRIKEHAEEICRGHHGEGFEGLGKNWVNQFVERHQSRLKPYWSRPLDHSRACAGNENTKKAYFDLLYNTIQGEDKEEPIPPELMYGTDESGIQEGIGTKERVYGASSKKVQHLCRWDIITSCHDF